MPNSNLSQARVFYASEFGEIDLPLGELVRDDGSIDLAPSAKRYFDVRQRSGQIRLFAKGYVGAFQIHPSIVVVVQSKAGAQSIARLLTGDRQSLAHLEDEIRSYGHDRATRVQPFEILLWQFLKACEAVISEGLWQPYRRTTRAGPRPAGRWNFAGTARRFFSHGTFHKAVTNVFLRDANTFSNLILKQAIHVALSYRGLVSGVFSAQQEEVLFTMADLLDSLPTGNLIVAQQEVKELLSEGKIPESRGFYAVALPIALKILAGTTPDIQSLGRISDVASFAVSMEDLFEGYLLRVLKDRVGVSQEGLWVEDGNKEGKKTFYEDREEPLMEPDIRIHSAEAPPLIIDSKYKPRYSAEDRYQVVSYALGYDAEQAVLVLPRMFERSGLRYIGKVRGSAGPMLHEYYFDLRADDAEKEEEKFAKAMMSLVTKDQLWQRQSMTASTCVQI